MWNVYIFLLYVYTPYLWILNFSCKLYFPVNFTHVSSYKTYMLSFDLGYRSKTLMEPEVRCMYSWVTNTTIKQKIPFSVVSDFIQNFTQFYLE